MEIQGAIINATIVTMDENRRIIQDGGILWLDEKIHMVADSESVKRAAIERCVNIENGNKKVIFPGLINTHTHIYQNLLKGLGMNLSLKDWWPRVIAPAGVNIREKHVSAAAFGQAIESIRSGCTTVVDYMQVHPTAELSDVLVEGMLKAGVRIVYGRGFRNTGAELGFPKELIEDTKFVFDDVLRLKKKYQETGSSMVKIMLAPAAAWALTFEGLRESSSFAKENDIFTAMHMFETDIENQICQEKYGKTALSYFEDAGLLSSKLLAIHCVKVGNEELDAFRNYNVKISHNPVSNMLLASGVSPIPQMLKIGLDVGLATDGAASNNCNDMLEILKITALIHKVYWNDPTILNAESILEMATIKAAKTIGMDGEIGSLEEGKRADFFIINPYLCARTCPIHDPIAALIYSVGSRAVEKVVVNGCCLLENSELVTIDEEKSLKNLQEMAVDIGKHVII